MTIVLIVIAVLSYLASAGFMGNYITTRARLRCTRTEKTVPCLYGNHEHGGWWAAGAFWPLTLPVIAASTVAPRIAYNHENRVSREERRYQKEVRKAQHHQDILAIREKEIKRLEREAGIR
jgi:hypothetical protein